MSVDLLHQVEIKEVVDIGYLNGLFVLARSIGLIGAVSMRCRAEIVPSGSG